MNENNSRVLLCESDANLASVMAGYLRNKNCSVDVADSAENAIEQLQKYSDYTCCLLDTSMPRKRAYRVLEFVRSQEKHVPVIALTNHSSVEDLVALYEMGADDVVRKPIVMEIIYCKIEVLVRRSSSSMASKQTVFDLAGRTFDSVKQRLDDQHLSGRESDLLLMLCRNRNEVVDRRVILRNLWGADNFYTSRSLSVYANHLRHLLEGTNIRVMSVHGKGYKLVDE